MNDLAWIRAAAGDPNLRDGAEAVALAGRASQLSPTAETLDTLSVALAEAGRFDQAITTARQAVGLARTTGRTDLVTQIEAQDRSVPGRQALPREGMTLAFRMR